MPLYRFDRKVVLFIHIPKTGGTSVEGILRRHASEALFFPGVPEGMRCTPHHLHAAPLENLIPPGFVDYAFCVVRNPVDRLVSEFYYRHRPRNILRVRSGLWQKRVATENAEQQQLSRAFGKWLSKNMKRYRKDSYLLDNHFRPQSEFACYQNAEVFRLEDGLSVVIEKIEEITGVRLGELDRHNASVRRTFMIDPNTIEKIREFYRPDFRYYE